MTERFFKHTAITTLALPLLFTLFTIIQASPSFAGGPGVVEMETFDTQEESPENDFDDDDSPWDGPNFIPTGGKTPIDPTPTDDDDDDEEEAEESDGGTSTQFVEIVLNQSLLDNIATKILPVVANDSDMNAVRTVADIEKDNDIGHCHVGGKLRVEDINIYMPMSDEALSASFGAESSLQTSWDFSDASYVTAKMVLDAPRTPLGDGCKIWEWLLMGDVYITGDIEVSGIKLDADFSLKAANNKVIVKNINSFEANPDNVSVEINDLEGGGLIKALVDAGIGISTSDFSCDSHSSFEECLEQWAEAEIINTLESQDTKESLKTAINGSLDVALAIEESNEVSDHDISYGFSLAGLANTPDNTGLITQWNVSFTNDGASDSCANALTYEQTLSDVDDYTATGAIDGYVPLWLIEKLGYFFGKWGYFCSSTSETMTISDQDVSYDLSIKPSGKINLLNNFVGLAMPVKNFVSGLGVTPTDQTAPAPESSTPYQIGSVKQIQNFQNFLKTNDDAVMGTVSTRNHTLTNTVLMQSDLNAPHLDDSEGEAFTFSVPVQMEFSGNVRGDGTATLKANARLIENDDGGINMKIDSVSLENASGPVTISLMGGNVQETADIADFDLESKIADSMQSALGTLETPLIPKIFSIDEAYGLGAGIGDITTVNNAAMRIPLTLSDDQDEENTATSESNKVNTRVTCIVCSGESKQTPAQDDFLPLNDQIRDRL